MVQLEELHYCDNCDAEFSVYPGFDPEEEVSFCPYCGSELKLDEDEDDYDSLDDFDEDDSFEEN